MTTASAYWVVASVLTLLTAGLLTGSQRVNGFSWRAALGDASLIACLMGIVYAAIFLLVGECL